MTHVTTLGKFMSRYGTALLVKWMVFYYKTVIYSGFINYIFPHVPQRFSLGKYMLEVWLDISVRTGDTDSTGQI